MKLTNQKVSIGKTYRDHVNYETVMRITYLFEQPYSVYNKKSGLVYGRCHVIKCCKVLNTERNDNDYENTLDDNDYGNSI